MKKSRYTEEQIVGVLKESEAGLETAEPVSYTHLNTGHGPAEDREVQRQGNPEVISGWITVVSPSGGWTARQNLSILNHGNPPVQSEYAQSECRPECRPALQSRSASGGRCLLPADVPDVSSHALRS